MRKLEAVQNRGRINLWSRCIKIQCCSEIYDRRKIGSAGKGSLHLCGADQRWTGKPFGFTGEKCIPLLLYQWFPNERNCTGFNVRSPKRDYRTAIKRSTHKSTWLRGSLKIFYMRQRSSSVNCFCWHRIVFCTQVVRICWKFPIGCSRLFRKIDWNYQKQW